MNELFIGGGGFDGFTFLGALEYIHKNELLDLKNFYGCSIGALIGIMYVSGKSPTEILDFLLRLDPKEIAKLDISNIQTNYAIFDSFLLESIIEGIDYPDETTLLDVYDMTGIHVNIFVTNVTINEYQNLSDTNTPNVKLKDALRASMSIPLLFPPVVINNEKYIDGCCKNIYGSHPDDKYIIGYSIIGKKSNNADNFLCNIFYSMINDREPRGTFIIKCDKTDNIDKYLNINDINKVQFVEMYSSGVNFAKDQLT